MELFENIIQGFGFFIICVVGCFVCLVLCGWNGEDDD